ncbi:MAG: LAGLIDADG family homing endonuclease, partial [Patescibacteria group bacterium]|nr:LAGLIDADG family homing endonuclease [Patescibacteria group bacterium]
MYSALLGIGGKRKKGKKMLFPEIPEKFLPDFIRGYFDGDGSVFYTTYLHSKIHRMRTELRSNFTSGSPEFLERLKSILAEQLSFTNKKICPFNNKGSWKFG